MSRRDGLWVQFADGRRNKWFGGEAALKAAYPDAVILGPTGPGAIMHTMVQAPMTAPASPKPIVPRTFGGVSDEA